MFSLICIYSESATLRLSVGAGRNLDQNQVNVCMLRTQTSRRFTPLALLSVDANHVLHGGRRVSPTVVVVLGVIAGSCGIQSHVN